MKCSDNVREMCFKSGNSVLSDYLRGDNVYDIIEIVRVLKKERSFI